MMSWFTESNRKKHFILAIPFGFLFTILCVIGLATGMEFKDCHFNNGNKPLKDWDWSSFNWLDFLATILGGVVGQLLQLILLFLILLMV